MKKLVYLLCFLGAAITAMSQPKPLPAPGYTGISDTLHYYLNKYYFTHGSTNLTTYPKFRAPHNGINTNNPDYLGVRFENADTVVVTGLEGVIARGPVGVSQAITVRLYLCLLDISGKPIIPGIDSVSISLGLSSTVLKATGGNFAISHTLTSDYAVLFKNWSAIAGDTVFVAHNAAVPVSNTTAPASSRFSDGNYAYIRHQGQIHNTANYTITPGFGTGTDYEFMLAPRVSYRMQASHKIPQSILDANLQSDSVCTRTAFTFTNTSSYFFTNRFYNSLELYCKWAQYAPFIVTPLPSGWPADSAISWYFEFDDQPPFIINPIKYLPYKHQGQNNQTVTNVTDHPGCFPANEFRAVHKQMGKFSKGTPYVDKQTFKICMKYCNGDAVAVNELWNGETFVVYPNPAVDHKVRVTGLENNNNIRLIDLTGRTLLEITTSTQSQEIDLSSFTSGSYILLVENERGERSWVKLVH